MNRRSLKVTGSENRLVIFKGKYFDAYTGLCIACFPEIIITQQSIYGILILKASTERNTTEIPNLAKIYIEP